jgi:magnesium transporter
MSSKYRKRRRKKLTLRQPDVSQTMPGTTSGAGSGHSGKLELIAYGPHDFTQETLNSAADLTQHVDKNLPVTWVNLDGTGDVATVEAIGRMFNLHELAVEDIVNLHQRAKVEEYNNHLFIVLRMAQYRDHHIQQEQLCIVLGENFVLTFQEAPDGDCLDDVRERIRKAHGHIRNSGPDYLMYSIVDAVVDGYFPILEGLGDSLEELEDAILEKYDKWIPARVLELKRDVLTVRRAVWPAREALNVLIRDDLPHVSANTKVYLRDCYDHVVRIIDLVETQRELCSDLMDLFLSSMSNRMNEVMKVLTTITLLFMPPTLVAGVYGMNFNTQLSPWNMPELNWYYGYAWALGLMLVSAVAVFSWAKARGWLRSDDVQTDAATAPPSTPIQPQ